MSDDDVNLFMDAVHPTQATKITSEWVRKRVDKIINRNVCHRMNIVAAHELNYLSATVFDQFKTVNDQVVIEFFQKIRSAYASKTVIHRVLDAAGYHRSKEVVDEAKKLGMLFERRFISF